MCYTGYIAPPLYMYTKLVKLKSYTSKIDYFTVHIVVWMHTNPTDVLHA